MDIKTLIANDNRMSNYPTVVIRNDLTVDIFNNKFREMFPGVSSGDGIENCFTIINKEELFGKDFSSPAVICAFGEWFLCAFCRIGQGADAKYSFMIAPPGSAENDGSFQYLVSKLSVLCKCRENADLSRKHDPARSPSGYEKLCRKIDACVTVSEAAYGKKDPCPVDIKEFLDDAFSYYSRIIFEDGKKHFSVNASYKTVCMNSVLCVSLMVLFRFSVKNSSNGFAIINVGDLQNGESMDFIFRPGKKFLKLLSNDDMLYSALGFDAADLIFIKKLVRENNGQVDIISDPESDSVKVSLFISEKQTSYVKSPPFVPEYIHLSHILADVLL